MAVSDPFDMERFVKAQQGVYETAFREIKAGRKRSHWMWFIFPQIAGLGTSAMSQAYAIGSPAEARAFLDHAVLGPRLRRCAEAMLSVKARSAHDILGSPDDLKFHSSMTLFARTDGDDSIFQRALDHFFDGDPDERTVERLGSGAERLGKRG